MTKARPDPDWQKCSSTDSPKLPANLCWFPASAARPSEPLSDHFAFQVEIGPSKAADSVLTDGHHRREAE
jgi:hypothetical protein